jgi:predicted DNA-binding ribbon-helix-helix protein
VTSESNSRLETFSIKLGGRWTTIRLEREMMHALREIARDLAISLHDLCTEVAMDRAPGSFTSALRIFIVNHYRRALAEARMPTVKPRVIREVWPTDPYQVRRHALRIGARDVAPELASLFCWWSDHRARDGRVPRHDEIDPGLLRTLGLNGLVHTVDASASDPLNYRFRVFGHRVVETGGRDFAGCRLGDLPGKDYQAAAAEDYFTAVTMGVPRLQEVDASVGSSRRVYQRLIVPFSGGRGKPDCLLVAVRYKSADLIGKLGQNLRA